VTINVIEGFWAFAEEEIQKHLGVGSEHFGDYLKEKNFAGTIDF
jgi:transposase-like protein